MSTDFRAQARGMANWLWFQAGFGVVAFCAGMALLGLKWPLLLGLPALALSALLAFDAWLFRMMAYHPDEMNGGRAVDDFLAGAGLKAKPMATRDLSSRIAGTRRLVYGQRVAAGLFLLACLFFAWTSKP